MGFATPKFNVIQQTSRNNYGEKQAQDEKTELSDALEDAVTNYLKAFRVAGEFENSEHPNNTQNSQHGD